MCARLHLPCLLERLGAPAYLIQLIKDVHTNTWMTVGTQRIMATTKRGTRPGSPLADCIFHVLMSDILHHLQTWIDKQEAFNEILREFDIPGSFVAWADDLAIPWATRRADEMPGALQTILSFVMQLFQRYGFLLNLDKGKTSAVVSFRGTGAPQMRQRFQLGPQPGDTLNVAGQTVFLHYVPSYKHLGTIFAPNHKMDLEIRSRIGQAQAAFNQISKPILGIGIYLRVQGCSCSTPLFAQSCSSALGLGRRLRSDRWPSLKLFCCVCCNESHASLKMKI